MTIVQFTSTDISRHLLLRCAVPYHTLMSGYGIAQQRRKERDKSMNYTHVVINDDSCQRF